MTPSPTPLKLDLQKDRQLTIDWHDGRQSVYPVAYLRAMCPCAKCKIERQAPIIPAGTGKLTLRVLSSNYTGPTIAVSAELVGNYALRIEWSDKHGSGIYSFEYLRSIDPAHVQAPPQDIRSGPPQKSP